MDGRGGIASGQAAADPTIPLMQSRTGEMGLTSICAAKNLSLGCLKWVINRHHGGQAPMSALPFKADVDRVEKSAPCEK
jgi:hypothetical protein